MRERQPRRPQRDKDEPIQIDLFTGPDVFARPDGALRGRGRSGSRGKRRDAPAQSAGTEAQTPVLSPPEAARYLKVSASTLKSWRAKKTGPAWVKRGARLVCYLRTDLDAFLEKGVQRPKKP